MYLIPSNSFCFFGFFSMLIKKFKFLLSELYLAWFDIIYFFSRYSLSLRRLLIDNFFSIILSISPSSSFALLMLLKFELLAWLKLVLGLEDRLLRLWAIFMWLGKWMNLSVTVFLRVSFVEVAPEKEYDLILFTLVSIIPIALLNWFLIIRLS